MKILVTEDNALLGKSIKKGLEENGWTVDLAKDGEEGEYFLACCEYDVVVLDWMLPKRSGIELLQTLRKRGNSVPTIMITAKGALSDKIEGLDGGADDYLVKPFEMAELFARVNALYRRSLGRGQSILNLGQLAIDVKRHQVRLRGAPLELTGKEFDLLVALASRHGQLVKRSTLAGMVYELDGEPESNSLDVLLARVRKKLVDTDVEIVTIRGKGFILSVAETSP